uniref:Rho GTPase activating protein 20 n=1 Tax=Nothobranchius kadleci TaxID=1051664 RepID=A0A1A8EJH3_NOTKA
MDSMSPQQQQDSLSRGQQDNKRRFHSYRRQSAPSLVITKALTRSKTVSRDSFQVSVCPETCSLVQSLLTGSDRFFLLYGHAQLKTGMQTQDRHLFLFSDVLVIAKAKSANHFKQKLRVSVCEMWIAGCMDEVCEGSTSPERSFVIGWPTWNCVAVFSSAEQKEKWLSLLKSRIKEEKEKEDSKTIPLRVYGKGINTFAVTKTLPVSNSDSTNEVIRLALQQFGIIGNVKDFQLWVISRRDNTPYPLIGHEFPFSIQMNHVRTSTFHGGGRDALALPSDRQVQVEHLHLYKQCQFILKPRPVEPLLTHIPADFSQKTLKQRRSLISWAFWRGSSPHLHESQLGGAPQGCLFGHKLSIVCWENTLPKPVMDMLVFLYHEGSWTRGIFRRPAGARAVRELRESLDAGEVQLPFTRDHVFVVAGVFKDFLRSLPGSLLGCELFEEWLDVLEDDDEEEEQVHDVKRMIRRLSKESSLLLRYLLALLHSIQSHSQENQMTSFNLSVCIAPSLLWPPGAPCNPELEGEATKKVCELVKFMIVHCPQILGEDPTSLFGGPPRRLSGEETGSESWVYTLTDSSYDSLENELDDCSVGSPGSYSRSHTQPKPLQSSLDSILTFSDYEQDTDPEAVQPKTGVGLHRRDGCRRQNTSGEDVSFPLDSMSLEGGRAQRRRSEPAIAYTARFCPYTSGSADELAAEEDDAEGERKSGDILAHTHTRGRSRSGVLEASFSSLSSTSPAPTRSSLDSLDSLGTDPTEADPHRIPPPSPFSSGFAQTSVEHANKVYPKDCTPKEPVHWGALKGCIGLHPNSWLRKDRRLSLTQQEGPDVEREDVTGGESVTAEKPEREPAKRIPISQAKPPRRGSNDAGDRGTSRHPEQDSSKPLRLHPSEPPPTVQTSDVTSESDVIKRRPALRKSSAQKQTSPSLFYKHSGPSLSLFRRNKTHLAEELKDQLCQRRGSEPGRQVVDRASTSTLARLPSDPCLKVTDSKGGTTEACICLSSCSTKVVRDYFLSHPRSHPQSSQQVAKAVAEGRREWLKRCNDPKVEPDVEQLLFAEESYV